MGGRVLWIGSFKMLRIWMHQKMDVSQIPVASALSLGRRENKAPCFKVREQKTLVLTSPVIHKL